MMKPKSKEKYNEGKYVFTLFKAFENYSLSYVYKGIFNPDLTDKILSLAETNMNLTKESSRTQKRVYFVMVESLQNITRHQDIHQAEENHAFFVVQNKNGLYELSSGNVIEKPQMNELKKRIDKINSLSANDLKEYYRDVLNNTGMSEKGGAGLGLIEMARRSGNKLSYDFENINDKLSYFYFKSKVTADYGRKEGSPLNEVKRLHQFTRRHHISMIYQGIFTHDNLKSLVSMTEGSVSKIDNLAFKRRAVNIMVELLQNICNHAEALDGNTETKPGILIVSTAPDGCNIISGNYIHTNSSKNISDKINRVNACSKTDLENLYSEMILKEETPSQKGAGLGFIDMRMKSEFPIQYSIAVFNEHFSFLSITVFIPF